jgi:hypothetical protein|tara:strand:+ start:1405 stop:1611 length:207 start_codon:yes stop_codon:yes gene_type:complete
MDMNKYYRQIVGCKITDFYMEDDDFSLNPWPVFVIKQPNSEGGEEYRLVLSQDEEGNGGGFAFIEEIK